MRFLRFLFLLLIPLVVFPVNQVLSQEVVTINGIVIDTTSGKGLPFAQISVLNCTIGTVTNEDGEFKLDIPSLFSKDTLLVTYMGYETLRRAVSGLQGKGVRLALKPGMLKLAEVEILSLSAEEVLKRVVANVPANYGKDSLVLTAFIRSQKFVNGKMAEFTEAIIEDMKTGYSLCGPKEFKLRKSQSNIPLLVKGRVISDTTLLNSVGEIGTSAGCLGCNFVNDFVEFYVNTVLDERLFPYYTFKSEELISSDGGKIYHIRFDQKPGVKKTLWKGEMFINGSDFALLKITQKPSFEAFDQFEKKKYKRVYMIMNTTGWYQEMPMMEWTTTYSQRDGTYYLNTIHIQNWLTFINPVKGRKFKFAYRNEVVVTEVTRDPGKIRNFRGDKTIGVNQRWDQIVGTTDDMFWVKFNYLPIEEKLKRDLQQISR